jgi:hypothetical protein
MKKVRRTVCELRRMLFSDNAVSRAALERLISSEVCRADPSAFLAYAISALAPPPPQRIIEGRLTASGLRSGAGVETIVWRVSNARQTLEALDDVARTASDMDDILLLPANKPSGRAWITFVNELAGIFRKHGTEPKAAKNKRDGYARLSPFCRFVKAVLHTLPDKLREHTHSDGTLAKHISDALVRPKDPIKMRPAERAALASLQGGRANGSRVSEIMVAPRIKTPNGGREARPKDGRGGKGRAARSRQVCAS